MRGSLLLSKPYVPCQSTAKGNTKSDTWPQYFELRAWLAFNIRTLNESYGYILDQPLPLEVADMVPSTSRLQGLVVEDDNGPKHIIAWNDKTVMPLVKYAKQLMGLHVGVVLHHEIENVEDGTRPRVPGLHRKTTIGHVIALGNYQRAVLVVGLSRTSVKWRGSTLIKNPNITESEPTWPIRQLANLCTKTGTRYGYIQTDEELVVCCFAATKLSQGQYADWKVFAMSVPWNMEMPQPGNIGARSSLMSTELALWWLCMLSMSDDNRSIVEAKDIVPIDTWDTVHLVDKNTFFHRHRYSGFEKPAPPPAEPQQDPVDPFLGANFDLDSWLGTNTFSN